MKPGVPTASDEARLRGRHPMDFDTAVALIRRHDSYPELAIAVGESAETTYRKLAKLIHPDAAGDARSATATEAFAKLSRLYAGREAKLSGAIADLTRSGQILRKVPREPRDNDLMEAEAAALKTLQDKGDPKFRPYAPELIKTYVHEDPQRRRRVVNELEFLDGFVPLPAVEDWRDAAWMWRRLLVALGWAHRAGVVHGAIFEEHVLIHPGEHGLALVDWCYSSPRPTAVIAGKHYPPEVVRDKEITPATDIYLATALMKRVIGDGMPAPLKRFADGCLFDAPRMRPQDAWRLLEELDELLGPRKFRPFTI
ncbi:molecular chaperone DnaJ [Actinoplanes sp. NPDC026619]|uniref:molecular chaperone DnaJ n=1 Tax=Actinoplanes sp. NPDC026619 TaxID=3155798 RepID=UPI0033D4EC74